MPLLRTLSRLSLAFGLVVIGTPHADAGVSPQGDTAVAWPTTWNSYRLASGTPVYDVLGDENPDNADLSSGPCTGSGCAGTLPTVYYASDGTTAFFRMRIAVDPADATKGGLTGNAYLTQIAVNNTVVAVAGVDGKSASVDYVYVASAPGTTVTQIYTWPFTSPSAGMRVVPDGTGDYFIDWQVPIARLTTISGGAVTATSPIKLYWGSSAAANLATLNKDLMLGATNTVSFANVSTISFSPSSLAATSAAVKTSGPAPTVGQASQYTVTWTLNNAGGGELSNATSSATLPAGVTFVSGPGVSTSGSTVTWNAGTLLPGETDTVTFVVSLTPGAGTEGTNVPLLSQVNATGTDLATGAARNATAPALTAGPVAAAPPPNATPVVSPDTLTVVEDASNTVNVLANDSDANGDPLTVTVTGAPAHGTTSVAGGVVTYTPDPNYNGPDVFTYTACDPSAACASTTVTVTVTAVNDAPAGLANTSFSTPEDTAHSAILPAATDVDGDALTYSAVTQPAHGTVTVNPNGTYTYTPDADYHGPDSFTYRACDPSAACVVATATVTVTPVNDAPGVLSGVSFSTPEDTPHSGSLPAGADADGETLTYSVTAQPSHGDVTVNPDGTYTYTPDANYSGPDTFGYQVCDAAAACSAAAASVTVTPVNDAPAAPPGSAISTPEDTARSGSLPGSSDPDGDPLTFSVATQPEHGDLTVNPDGTYTYTPDAGYVGPDTFTYQVCDPAGACAAAVVTVTVVDVIPGNIAPIAIDDTPSTPMGTPVVVNVLANDSDANNDTLAIDSVTQGANGTVTIGAGSVTYTPNPGFSGTDSFTYTACDASLACDTATVTVTVLAPPPPPNNAPVADAGDDVSVRPGVVHLDGSGSSDPDGDPLTYAWVQVSGPTVTLTGADTATPSFVLPATGGPVVLQLTVSDGTAVDTDTVTIAAAPVVVDPATPPAPACGDESLVVKSGGTVTVTLDCDDAAGSTVTVVGAPAHGSTVVLSDGSIRYVAPPGYVGTDAFTVRVCVGAVCTDATVTVDVLAGEVRRGSRLPNTGSGAESLLPMGVVLVLVGAAAMRRGARGEVRAEA